jgi:hypothetical protein
MKRDRKDKEVKGEEYEEGQGRGREEGAGKEKIVIHHFRPLE